MQPSRSSHHQTSWAPSGPISGAAWPTLHMVWPGRTVELAAFSQFPLGLALSTPTHLHVHVGTLSRQHSATRFSSLPLEPTISRRHVLNQWLCRSRTNLASLVARLLGRRTSASWSRWARAVPYSRISAWRHCCTSQPVLVYSGASHTNLKNMIYLCAHRRRRRSREIRKRGCKNRSSRGRESMP